MGQVITDIAYMIVGIGVMSMCLIIGIVGIMRVLRDIRNIKDTEE